MSEGIALRMEREASVNSFQEANSTDSNIGGSSTVYPVRRTRTRATDVLTLTSMEVRSIKKDQVTALQQLAAN